MHDYVTRVKAVKAFQLTLGNVPDLIAWIESLDLVFDVEIQIPHEERKYIVKSKEVKDLEPTKSVTLDYGYYAVFDGDDVFGMHQFLFWEAYEQAVSLSDGNDGGAFRVLNGIRYDGSNIQDVVAWYESLSLAVDVVIHTESGVHTAKTRCTMEFPAKVVRIYPGCFTVYDRQNFTWYAPVSTLVGS